MIFRVSVWHLHWAKYIVEITKNDIRHRVQSHSVQKYSTWYNQVSNDLERMPWCHLFAGIFPVKMTFDGSLQEMKIIRLVYLISLVHLRLQMLYLLSWLVIVKANNSEANSKIHFTGFDLDSTLHFEISPATQPIIIRSVFINRFNV